MYLSLRPVSDCISFKDNPSAIAKTSSLFVSLRDSRLMNLPKSSVSFFLWAAFDTNLFPFV